MKVKAIKRFYDQKEKTHREVNDEFVVSKERAEELNRSAFGQLVEEVPEEPKDEPKKSPKK